MVEIKRMNIYYNNLIVGYIEHGEAHIHIMFQCAELEKEIISEGYSVVWESK